jgi:hypothetical protein
MAIHIHTTDITGLRMWDRRFTGITATASIIIEHTIATGGKSLREFSRTGGVLKDPASFLAPERRAATVLELPKPLA